MAETLEAFLTRQLRIVEADGRSTTTVKLIPLDEQGDELEPFERWDSPLAPPAGPGAQLLAETIAELCTGYAEDFPKGVTVTMAVICEDASGERRGRHFRRVTGQSQVAKRAPGGPAAITDGVQAIVRASKEMLAMQTQQSALFANQSKQLIESQQKLVLVLTNERLRQAEEPVASGGDDQMAQLVKEFAPKALGLLQMFVQIMADNKTTGAASAPSIGTAVPPTTTTEN